LLSHYSIFKSTHVWTSTMSLLKSIFTMFFAYYGMSKHKEVKRQKNYNFISYDVMLKYICTRKMSSQCLKKYKYTQEMIEMIFNIYESYNIY
jgi:hypothetical protein